MWFREVVVVTQTIRLFICVPWLYIGFENALYIYTFYLPKLLSYQGGWEKNNYKSGGARKLSCIYRMGPVSNEATARMKLLKWKWCWVKLLVSQYSTPWRHVGGWISILWGTGRCIVWRHISETFRPRGVHSRVGSEKIPTPLLAHNLPSEEERVW